MTEQTHSDPEWIKQFNREANEKAIWWIRDFAKTYTGGNCTFADDDFRVIGHFAIKAMEAEMFDGVPDDMAAKIKAATDSRKVKTDE